MPEKMQFTKARVAALESLPAKQVTAYDEGQKGLCIRVTPAGAKTFYCVRKVEGMNRHPRSAGYGAAAIRP